MNESFFIHLDSKSDWRKLEPLLKRMDKALEKEGWVYSGIRNMYVPVDPKQRDETIWCVREALKQMEELKPYKPRLTVGHLTNAAALLKIDVSRMIAPSERKLKRYEDYYLKHHELSHGIMVDETGEIRDGYISYLLAMKYSAKVDIMEAWKSKPLKKMVAGQYVNWDGRECTYKSEKSHCAIYDLKQAVIPGDILLVRTKRGSDYMRVSKVTYVTGEHSCSRYGKVMKNETADL